MRKIITGRVYDTKTGKQIASNYYWDGRNYDRDGRNCYLYASPHGAFFAHYTSRWDGEHDRIEPLTKEDAQELYDQLYEQDEAAYTKYFGEPEEAGSDDGYHFTLRGLSGELHGKIKTAAEKAGQSMNTHLLKIISEALA